MGDVTPVVIVGGGPVGMTLAIALAAHGVGVTLIEAGGPVVGRSDPRTIALNESSRRILAALGLWEAMCSVAEPILKVHVSERGRFGVAVLDARESGVAALGHVLPAQVIHEILSTRVVAHSGITRLRAEALACRALDTHAEIEVRVGDETRVLRTALVVAADGAESRLRTQAGVTVTRHDYGHTALLAAVVTEKPHCGIAYERFTPEGPLALLPMQDGRSALIWTRAPAEAARLLAADDAAFLAGLQGDFGWRLGRLSAITPRRCFPLTRVFAERITTPRLALIGAAAQSLHPVAAQGLNLALRDVAALAERVVAAALGGADCGAAALLEGYAAARADDRRTALRFTDSLARLFTPDFPLVALGRSLGLVATGLLPPLRRRIARYGLGLEAGLPRLARGLPLR
jgi:2-octaprenyl-6-methoxyphenol hydroxylase